MMAASVVCTSRALLLSMGAWKAARCGCPLHFCRGLQAEKKLGEEQFFTTSSGVWVGQAGSKLNGLPGAGREVRTAERVLADSQACAAAAAVSNPGIQQRRPEPHQHSSSSNKQTGCHLRPSQRNRQRKMEGLLFNVNNGYVVLFGVIYLCATSERHKLTCWGSPSPPLQLHRGHRPRLSQRTAHRHQLHQHDTMREHRW